MVGGGDVEGGEGGGVGGIGGLMGGVESERIGGLACSGLGGRWSGVLVCGW